MSANPKQRKDSARKLSEFAKELYAEKKYDEALKKYTELIELYPNNAIYYANRAACYIMLRKYRNGLDDGKKCIELDSQLFKAYARVVKCCLALGDIIQAETALRKMQEFDEDKKTTIKAKKDLEYIKQFVEDADIAYVMGDYRKVVYCMDRCCDVSTFCTKFKLKKAECLTYLRRYHEAQDIANHILYIDEKNVDAIYVRALCLYYEGNLEKAFAYFQQVLKLAPDHKALEQYKRAKRLKQKKEEGNTAYNAEQYQKAYQLYTEALTVDLLNTVTNAKLHFNKAVVAAKLNRLNESVTECTQALQLNETYLKALLHRAASYMKLEQYEQAVCDLEKACQMDKSRDTKRLLMEAKLAQKKSKRKDFYKILGIDKNASTDDIKKAYRKRAMIHHPDRHPNATEKEKKQQEKMFKEVGEAYGILSDPKKRSRYDSGHGICDGNVGFQDDDLYSPFQMFRSGGSTFRCG